MNTQPNTMRYFKAFIRVIKTINSDCANTNQVIEPFIIANDKNEVKEILRIKYPQFFQSGKVYEKETKDKAQFFYVVIFELSNYEKMQVEKGEWICSYCGQRHENIYVEKPAYKVNMFGYDKLFCKSEDNYCLNNYIREIFKDIELKDDFNFVKKDSPNYIYKITEKTTKKCYIGKTKNEPFFRWWNHYKHSTSPFGKYLQGSKIIDWTFEVLEILPSNISDREIFRIESEYIKKFDSIHNGFNSLISNKSVYMQEDETKN